jgi:predicted metalloprotease with PDZ domain
LKISATFVLLGISLAAHSSYARGQLQFSVDLRDTKSHTVHVTMKPTGFTARAATYQMPVWAPGAYSVTGYGRYVVNFKAFDKNGRDLAVKQVNENRWEIASGKSVQKIEYDVLDSHKDTTSLYFAMANIDTTLFFANATALFGYFDDDKTAGAQVNYELPTGWKLACPLEPKAGYAPNVFSNIEFVAKNYDELADAPILAAPETVRNHSDYIVTASFREGKADYDVAVATDGTWSDAKMDSLTYYLREIVHAETDFFHDTPYKHYTFEIVAPTLSRMPSFAQGALEHANSSDYLLADFGWSMFKGSFLSIFSHEFFHLWNVKRIHSNLLGPFDYTQRVMTTSLWMAEGITEYYAHTLLARYGIISPEKFFSDVNQWREEMAMAPASANVKSLEALSIDESTFEMDEATLFYSRGPLVAMMLDIEIRSRTNNKKSLDDVMLALDNDAKRGKTFGEKELIHKVEKYAGIDLTDFYNKYIHGTDSLPFDAYLEKMGLTRSAPDAMGTNPPLPKLSFSILGDSGIVFDAVDSSTAFAHAGIRAGDFVMAINGTKFNRDNIMELSELLSPSDSRTGVTLSVLRVGMPVTIPVLFSSIHHKPSAPEDNHLGSVEVVANATSLATAIRKGIVGQ